MSWPNWPQGGAAVQQGPQIAPVPAPVPPAAAPLVPSASISVAAPTPAAYATPPGAGAAPPTYTAAQYAALTPEQQYAMQQNWQQWQTYHQQYAQWHAQYGEQYQREMQAKLGSTAPPLPFAPPVSQYSAPVPPTAYSAPPPPPPDNPNEMNNTGLNSLVAATAQPPPPPPPPENDGSSGKLPSLLDLPTGPIAGPVGDNKFNMWGGTNQNFQDQQRNQASFQGGAGFPGNAGGPGFQQGNQGSGFQQGNQGFPGNQGSQGYQNSSATGFSGNQGNQGGFQGGSVMGNQSGFQGNQGGKQGGGFQGNQENRSRWGSQDNGGGNQGTQSGGNQQGNRNRWGNQDGGGSGRGNQGSGSGFQGNQENRNRWGSQDGDQNNQFDNNSSGRNFNDRRSFGGNDRDRDRRSFGGGNNFNDNDRNNFSDNDRNSFNDNDRNNFNDNDRNKFNDNDRRRFSDNNRGGLNIWQQQNNNDQTPQQSFPSSQPQQTLPQQPFSSSQPQQPLLPQQPAKQADTAGRTIESIMGDPDDGKTREERAFDEQFRKWEEEFERWKKQNANHPDRVAYREYEMKFEDCRRKLLERREQMRMRKMQQQQAQQPLPPPPQPDMSSFLDGGDIDSQPTQPQPVGPVQSPILPPVQQPTAQAPPPAQPAPEPAKIEQPANDNLPDMDLEDEDEPNVAVPAAAAQTDEVIEFLKPTKSEGGIPGLDLVPAEEPAVQKPDNDKLDEDVTEVINLEDEENRFQIQQQMQKQQKEHLQQQQYGFQFQQQQFDHPQPFQINPKREIPSLLSQKFEPPVLSPGSGVPGIGQDDVGPPLVDSLPTDQDGVDGAPVVPPAIAGIASALANSNILALLSAALGKTDNTAQLGGNELNIGGGGVGGIDGQRVSPWDSGPDNFNRGPNMGNFGGNQQQQQNMDNMNNFNQNQRQQNSPWQSQATSLMDIRFGPDQNWLNNNNNNNNRGNNSGNNRNSRWSDQQNFNDNNWNNGRNNNNNNSNQNMQQENFGGNDFDGGGGGNNNNRSNRGSRWGNNNDQRNLGNDNSGRNFNQNNFDDNRGGGGGNNNNSRWGGDQQQQGRNANNNNRNRGRNSGSDQQGSDDVDMRSNPFERNSGGRDGGGQRDRSRSNDNKSERSGGRNDFDDRKRSNPFRDSGAPPKGMARTDDNNRFVGGNMMDERPNSRGSDGRNRSRSGSRTNDQNSNSSRRNPFKNQDNMAAGATDSPNSIRSGGSQSQHQHQQQQQQKQQPPAPIGGDEFYKPAQVIDYQNKSLVAKNDKDDSAVKTPAPKVVDYGHKPTGAANSSDDFFPMKTIDYGHSSAVGGGKPDQDDRSSATEADAKAGKNVDENSEGGNDDNDSKQVEGGNDDFEGNADPEENNDDDECDEGDQDNFGGLGGNNNSFGGPGGNNNCFDGPGGNNRFGGGGNNNNFGGFNRGGFGGQGFGGQGGGNFQGGNNNNFGGFNRGNNGGGFGGGGGGFGGRGGNDRGSGGNSGQRGGGNNEGKFGNFQGGQGQGQGGRNRNRRNKNRNNNKRNDFDDDGNILYQQPEKQEEQQQQPQRELAPWDQFLNQLNQDKNQQQEYGNDFTENLVDQNIPDESFEEISDDDYAETFRNPSPENSYDVDSNIMADVAPVPVSSYSPSNNFDNFVKPIENISSTGNNLFPLQSCKSSTTRWSVPAAAMMVEVVPEKSVQLIFPSMENNNTITIDEILMKPGRESRPKKIVVILRGPPGSGKTYVAKLIKEKEVEMGGSAPRLLSIDDYFMSEIDKEEKCPKTGRKIIKKEMLYEYEKDLEENYNRCLMKSFKKTLDSRLYDFIIVDNINNTLRSYTEFYNAAKESQFTPYTIDLKCDLETCLSRNIHERSEQDIKNILAKWSSTPGHYIKLDVTSLLQSDAITEVEMEDISDMEEDLGGMDQEDESNLKDKDSQDEIESCDFLKSKWDSDPSEAKLARLDGINKPLHKSATLEDYLQIDGWEPPVSSSSNKKRVRWADIEEKRAQDKMRAIGFVVGQTDWSRMMDPTSGSKALTKTKYIEKIKR